MRVIAGTHGGRRLFAPPGKSARPTGDRVKEALFSVIGPFFEGGVCLDLFAGSGALGIEALSRGVERAVFVDQANGPTVAQNLAALGLLERSEIFRCAHTAALAGLARAKRRFDLIFLDPPYAMNLLPGALALLARERLPADGAIVVAELDGGQETPGAAGLRLRREAQYGRVKLCVYRYEDPRGGDV